MNAQTFVQPDYFTTSNSRAETDGILVHEVRGSVIHSFMPFDEVDLRRAAIRKAGGFAEGYCVADKMGAEWFMECSPQCREHIEEAKRKVRLAIKWGKVMDRLSIPADPELREKVRHAMQEAATDAVLTALGPARRDR